MVKRIIKRAWQIFFEDFFPMIFAISIICLIVTAIGVIIVVSPQNLSFLELKIIALFEFVSIFVVTSIIALIACVIIAATVPENQNG